MLAKQYPDLRDWSVEFSQREAAADLDRTYRRSLDAMKRGDRDGALTALLDIIRRQPGYRDTIVKLFELVSGNNPQRMVEQERASRLRAEHQRDKLTSEVKAAQNEVSVTTTTIVQLKDELSKVTTNLSDLQSKLSVSSAYANALKAKLASETEARKSAEKKVGDADEQTKATTLDLAATKSMVKKLEAQLETIQASQLVEFELRLMTAETARASAEQAAQYAASDLAASRRALEAALRSCAELDKRLAFEHQQIREMELKAEDDRHKREALEEALRSCAGLYKKLAAEHRLAREMELKATEDERHAREALEDRLARMKQAQAHVRLVAEIEVNNATKEREAARATARAWRRALFGIGTALVIGLGVSIREVRARSVLVSQAQLHVENLVVSAKMLDESRKCTVTLAGPKTLPTNRLCGLKVELKASNIIPKEVLSVPWICVKYVRPDAQVTLGLARVPGYSWDDCTFGILLNDVGVQGLDPGTGQEYFSVSKTWDDLSVYWGELHGSPSGNYRLELWWNGRKLGGAEFYIEAH